MTLKASDISEGQEFSEIVAENLTRTQIVQYAGTSGDYNPIHKVDRIGGPSPTLFTPVNIVYMRGHRSRL